MTTARKPTVKIVHGQAITTSLKVAEFFGKEHYRVLRAIENLECSPEFRAANFGVSSYEAKQPNGGTKKQPMYTMTKNGFVFLAMGFTGKEAAQWKEKYIAAFDELERRALEKETAKRIGKPAAPAQLPAQPEIGADMRARIDCRAWQLAGIYHDAIRARMMGNASIRNGITSPEAWEPVECSTDALEMMESAAFMLEATAGFIRTRGRDLAKLTENDYDEAVKRFRGTA